MLHVYGKCSGNFCSRYTCGRTGSQYKMYFLQWEMIKKTFKKYCFRYLRFQKRWLAENPAGPLALTSPKKGPLGDADQECAPAQLVL